MNAKLFLMLPLLWVGFLLPVYAEGQLFPGKSLANSVSQQDTFGAIQPALNEYLRCFDIGVTNTTFLNYVDSQGNATDQCEVKGEWIATPWLESWTAQGCGRKVVLEVKFKPDPDPAKGTTYSVKIKE